MTTNTPFVDYTPEEKSRILAEMRARVTAEDLLEYATDDSPLIPLDELLRWSEEQVRLADAQRSAS